jgi:hypothetical protein
VSSRGRGLRDISPSRSQLKDLVVTTSLSGIELVRAGREPGIAPPWFLTNAAMIVEQAVDLADIVLFDTGPLLLTNEAVSRDPLDRHDAPRRAGRAVSYRQARDAIERLTRVGANVGGVALVGGEDTNRYGYYESPTKPPRTFPKAGSHPGGSSSTGRDVTAGS